MKRQLLAVVVLLLLLAPALVAFAPPPQEQPDIELAISAGYNGYYRKGQWIAVRVTVSNRGDNLDGQVRARTGGGSGLDETTYSTPLDLPRGSRKQIFLYVSLDSYTSRVQIEVTDQHGGVVRREAASLRMVNQEDILAAVVTESPFGAVDLTAHLPTSGAGYQVNWRLEDIPSLAESLSGLDVMMFHDVDTGTLRAEQKTAISSWVLSGGHLIVAGGDAWQHTTAGLQDLLPTALKGTVSLSSMAALGDYLGLVPDELLEEGMTATDNTPGESARVLVALEDVPLVVRGAYGAGVIDFLAVDPHAEPLRSWAEKGALWYTMVASVEQTPSWVGGVKDWTIARQATLTTSSTVLPTIVQLCGFLALYIVLLGPINYVILRSLNRRELAWFTIPVLIIIFSVLAFKVGFNLRGNRVTVNHLTVVQVWPDTDQAEVTSLIGIQSPRRGSYDIAIERGYTLRVLPEEGVGLNVPTLIREGTRYAVDSIPIDAGTMASFVASGYRDMPRFDASATWHVGVDAAPRVEGYIVNTTGVTLEDAVILVKGASRHLGTLAPGETYTFDIALGPQDPGPLTLGYTGSWNRYGYNPWQSGYSSPGWCFSYNGIALTIPDVMGQESFSCSTSVTARQQEIRRRYRLLGALIADTDLSGGRDAGVYVLGWTNESLIGVDLAGKPQNEENTNLYIIDLPVDVVMDGESAEVPPGLTLWTLAERDDPATTQQISPVQFQIASDSQAAFQFMPLPAMRLSAVDELAIDFQAQGILALDLWNWSTARWVRVNFNPEVKTIFIRNPGRFIGPENAVNIRVTPTDDTGYNRVDYVKVAYRGRLE